MLFQFDVTQTAITSAVGFDAAGLFDLHAFTSSNVSNGVIGTFSNNDSDLTIGAYCISF